MNRLEYNIVDYLNQVLIKIVFCGDSINCNFEGKIENKHNIIFT